MKLLISRADSSEVPVLVKTICLRSIPAQKTPVPNLFLAGAHTETQAQVWSIEGAVESGRRAAKAIDGKVDVLDQYRPLWIKSLSRIDDILYSIHAPQVIDSVFIFLILFFLWLFFV